jgi:hypothetical protein
LDEHTSIGTFRVEFRRFYCVVVSGSFARLRDEGPYGI